MLAVHSLNSPTYFHACIVSLATHIHVGDNAMAISRDASRPCAKPDSILLLLCLAFRDAIVIANAMIQRGKSNVRAIVGSDTAVR